MFVDNKIIISKLNIIPQKNRGSFEKKTVTLHSKLPQILIKHGFEIFYEDQSHVWNWYFFSFAWHDISLVFEECNMDFNQNFKSNIMIQKKKVFYDCDTFIVYSSLVKY